MKKRIVLGLITAACAGLLLWSFVSGFNLGGLLPWVQPTPQLASSPPEILESYDWPSPGTSLPMPHILGAGNAGPWDNIFPTTPGSYTRPGLVASPDAVVEWYFHWCAENKKILDRNWADIEIHFLLDEKEVLLDSLHSHDNPWEASHPASICRWVSTYLHQWPVGLHSLRITTNFSREIDNGRIKYPAGLYIADITVKITQEATSP